MVMSIVSRRLALTVLGCALVASTPQWVFSAPKTGSVTGGDHFDDGVWVTVEGVVPVTDDHTMSEIKARSRNEARRVAVEQAVGHFVRGSTIVYNYVLADDLVQSVARGLVVEEQILEEGVRESTHESGVKSLFYATKLKARVKRVHSESKEHFKIHGSLNKTVFYPRDEMQIRVTSSRNAYLYIFNIGQDHSVTVLYPNRFAQNGALVAGEELIFPDEKLRSVGIVLRVVPPAGAVKAIERIKLVAVTHQTDFIKDRFKEGIFQVYDGKDTGLITDLLKALSALDDSEWAESTIAYEVNR
jgi:hypothetical protein